MAVLLCYYAFIMLLNNKYGDRMSSLIAGIGIILALWMLLVDWRYSLLAVLVVWNQFIFKEHLEGKEVKGKYLVSLISIVAWTGYLLFN